MNICIPVLAKDTAGVLEKMDRAALLAQMIEIRLDVMELFDLGNIVRNAPRPVIVTYRSKKEGGKGRAHYSTRVRLLSEAIMEGADFVDVEFSMPLGFREKIFNEKGNTKVILSRHMLHRTPSRKALSDLLRKMTATGADVIKIVTRARDPEDNLRVLQLVPMAKRLGIPIIAFCLGSQGRISRILSPLMGGFLTFASLEEGEESAEGQITAGHMKDILEGLNDED